MPRSLYVSPIPPKSRPRGLPGKCPLDGQEYVNSSRVHVEGEKAKASSSCGSVSGSFREFHPSGALSPTYWKFDHFPGGKKVSVDEKKNGWQA